MADGRKESSDFEGLGANTKVETTFDAKDENLVEMQGMAGRLLWVISRSMQSRINVDF